MRDRVILFVNGRQVEMGAAEAFGTLSDFLRLRLGLTGTKVVCAEGDCGSCSVLLGRPMEGEMRYSAVTSCIQAVYQLDGAHVITVEGLKYEGHLNPCQQAMVTCQGTQCGYCTPGFVVAMCGIFDRNQKPSEVELRRGLVGNLCRCTGYASILDAGLKTEGEKMKRINELYPEGNRSGEMWQVLEAGAGEAMLIKAGGKTVFKPVTVAEAVRFKAEHPACTILAGGTDIGVVVNKCKLDPQTILLTGGIAQLRQIAVMDGKMEVGANVTLTAWQEAAKEKIPAISDMLERHGSPLIRNAATLAGNIANGSPIGDAMPLLFVLDAALELTGPGGARVVDINAFYTGYRKTVMAAGELITRIIIPLPKTGTVVKFYKVSKREDLDISSFGAAIALEREGGVMSNVRVAFNGVAATIVRLPQTEAYLEGQVMSEAVMREAGRIARKEIVPISDVRGSSAFRLQLAENIFSKFYAELNGMVAESHYGRMQPVLTVNGVHAGNGKEDGHGLRG